jgi:SAM-dependent methyltransferase
MAETESVVRYRVSMVLETVKQSGRTRFDRVVDLGCGDGAVLRRIANAVGATEAVGIDLDVPEVQVGAVTLRRGDLFEFSPANPFDLVVSNQVFEHIYEPWLNRYFSALARSCAARGVVVLSTPNRWRALNLVRALTLRRPYMMQANPGVPPEQHLGHHRECSYRELNRILRSGFPPPDWKIRILRSAPRNEGSTTRWLLRLGVYILLWPLWRPLFVSASQDHYVAVERVTP